MKYSSILNILCAGLLVFGAVGVSSNSVSWGSRSLRDRHLIRQVIKEEPKMWRVVTRSYTFDQKGFINPAHITQIVVTDPRINGRGGIASLKRGGPKQTFAELSFKSLRGREIHLIVDIFGI